jgi:hypothetical protein
MLAALLGETAEDAVGFWQAAMVAVPLQAHGVMQGYAIGGKKAIMVDRGAAEAVARGRADVQPLPIKKGGKGGDGWWRRGPGRAAVAVLDWIRGLAGDHALGGEMAGWILLRFLSWM